MVPFLKDYTYVEDDLAVVGTKTGYLQVFSRKQNEIIHDFGQVIGYRILSLEKTLDNKYIFVSSYKGDCAQIDMHTGEKVNMLDLKDVRGLALSHDGKYLFTCQSGYGSGKITKYSIESP